jgi:serine/threonine protein kinase
MVAAPILIIPAALLGISLVVLVLVYVVGPVFKGLGWLISHVARFVWGMASDALRCVGALLMCVVYVPLTLANIIIGRWSASRHFGNAFMSELGAAGACAYRVVIGHPARLLLLHGLTEGLERRLPAVMAAAPTADVPTGNVENPSGKRGQFPGYTIVGSLAPGGSGAKLYIAEPDAVKTAEFDRQGIRVDQVVIKSFSLAEGSSLPQIVRESRSLDAAKRMGLILDHDLATDRFYYVMRYVPGESLSLVTRQMHGQSAAGGLGDAQLAAALRYTVDLVSTLSTYHRGGLWHKDVKPDNIIVASLTDRKAHLVDFGLVSSLRSAMTLTTHGTEYFRDPELVKRALQGVKVHEVDGAKFDIYASGAVLYSMIEDSFPAHGVLSQISKRCPESVKWVIRRAMTEYDKRYPTADAMLADLQYVAMAADPFAVKPMELPSMRGGFAGEGQAIDTGADAAVAAAAAAVAGGPRAARAGSSVPPPIPGGVGVPPPIPGGVREVPRIRVTNWWSGQVRVDGSDPAAATSSIPVPPQYVASARRMVDPANRRPAMEQVQAARARAEAARSRIEARFASRAGNRHFQSSPLRGGTALVMCVFVGALIGIGVLSTQSKKSIVTQDEQTMDGGFTLGGTEIIDDQFTRAPQFGPLAEVADMPIVLRNDRVKAPVAMPPAPPKIVSTVMVICDVKQPWSAATRAALEVIEANAPASGLAMVGEAPSSTATERSDTDIELAASLRMAVGQTPIDTSDCNEKVLAWLGQRPELGGVVWLAPDSKDGAAQPVFRAFRGKIEPASWRRLAHVLRKSEAKVLPVKK